MKVLMIVPGGVTPDGRGDVIPVLTQLAQSLASGCDICVLAVDDRPLASRDEAADFTILNTGRHPWPVLGIWLDSKTACRMLGKMGFEFDVIHSFWLGRPSTVAWLISRWHHRPWIASVGGQEIYARRLAGLPPGRRFIARLNNRIALSMADAVTAGSHVMVEELRNYGCSARWWPLFPNKERFHRKAPNTNGSSAPFRIITVADHSDVKDPSTLLRTIKLLATRGRDICLEWIGRELQPNYASELVASLGLKDRVRIRGHIPHRRIPEHLKSADLYLQSSRFESQGVAVCEAAACGLPLVGTAVGILRELAPGGAIVVEPGNPVALADAVERVICDTALRERLGGGAVEWMSNYSLDWTVENVLQLYNSLLLRPK